MATSISQQLFEFSVLLYGGIIAAFIYDVIFLYQNHFKPGKLLSCFQDLLYWIMMTSIIIYLLYYSSLGSIKGYSFIAMGFGYLIYKIFLSKIMYKTIERAVLCLNKVIKTCVKILRFADINNKKSENTHSKM